MESYGGVIPDDVEELKSLPGVGGYIASAVATFAFRRSEPILDTNTVRIIGRLLDVPLTDGSRRSKKFKQAYQSMMSPTHPREFNFAMIDLGALVCLPKEPHCNICPILSFCSYANSRRPEQSELTPSRTRESRVITQPIRLMRNGK